MTDIKPASDEEVACWKRLRAEAHRCCNCQRCALIARIEAEEIAMLREEIGLTRLLRHRDRPAEPEQTGAQS